MRKLYLLLDEWKNDRNFVGNEIEHIKQYFEVTVVCNDFSDKESCEFPKGVEFFFYSRRAGINAIIAIIKCLFDKEIYSEIKNLKKEKNKFAKLSEIVRFYVNGELFYRYLEKNKLIEKNSNSIFYSYWYFWKCFGICNHREEYPKIKLITRVHGYDIYKDQIPTEYQAFKHFMDRKLDRVLFISEHGLDYYENVLGIKKSDKHLLCRLGTNNPFGLNPYSIDSEQIRLVSCSSIIELKRVDLIVGALSLISDTKVEWIHFGEGPLFEKVSEKAHRLLDCKSNISYELMGYVPNDDILKFYSENSIDAFLMMSRTEGNPVSVIEAMSFGIPIISTNINNMPNIVNGNGILVSDNPNSWEIADAIISIGKKNPDVMAMRKKSRLIWEQNFQASNNIDKFINEVLLKL